MTMKKWCDDLFTWAIFNLVVALCWAGAEYYYYKSQKALKIKTYLQASSIATATATVIPTMGLLPAPMSPIISTLQGL